MCASSKVTHTGCEQVQYAMLIVERTAEIADIDGSERHALT